MPRPRRFAHLALIVLIFTAGVTVYELKFEISRHRPIASVILALLLFLTVFLMWAMLALDEWRQQFMRRVDAEQNLTRALTERVEHGPGETVIIDDAAETEP